MSVKFDEIKVGDIIIEHMTGLHSLEEMRNDIDTCVYLVIRKEKDRFFCSCPEPKKFPNFYGKTRVIESDSTDWDDNVQWSYKLIKRKNASRRCL